MRYCILLLLSLLNVLSFAQGISVSPSRIFFKGEPGQTVTQVITFTNQSQTPFTFVNSVQDWNRDSIGTKVYFPLGTLEDSNGDWLSLSEPTIHLSAGQTKTVNLSIRIPEERSMEKLTHSMVFFTQVKEQTQQQTNGLGINVLLEVGVQVYHVPAGLPAGDLEFIAFEDQGAQEINGESAGRMAVNIENTGKINKDAYVRFELTNMETGEEIPIKAIPIAMLPESRQWVSFTMPNLKGRFLAVAILDAGSQYDLKIAEKEIEF